MKGTVLVIGAGVAGMRATSELLYRRQDGNNRATVS
jgi:succinate dehydrogenase/fumarate reductase flavoprotein subunit